MHALRAQSHIILCSYEEYCYNNVSSVNNNNGSVAIYKVP